MKYVLSFSDIKHCLFVLKVGLLRKIDVYVQDVQLKEWERRE
ncbi:unnamed protein product [Paramecium octaurelia]|uniref:Uncharacterized protein n=1 Tax=Paramecium octaurelia TaxID=43137 RepID=A0A8S1YM25_PAROT|nr:unnamed protein product [Paramecium octaurelia]